MFENTDNYESIWKDYLFDWWQNSYKSRVVKFKDKIWFIKCKPENPLDRSRDYLGYLLGEKRWNVSEVYILANKEFAELQKLTIHLPYSATAQNTFLVRFGPSYELNELPIQDLDTSIASELVYSAWVRRRDAHSFNRTYLKGVPVFFDHETAFLAEPDLSDLEFFFQKGKDAGYAGNWRLKTLPEDHTPKTMDLRRRELASFKQYGVKAHTIQPCYCINKFNSALDEASSLIQSISQDELNEKNK